MPIDERELTCTPARPLHAWRLFRVRRGESGYTLTAPLIHDPDYEHYPTRVIRATCYEQDHPAPAPGCRCGLYAVVEGTLDSLSGYLLDSAHDIDPAVYAEVACTGRVFLDARGVRTEQLEVVRLVASADAAWPGPEAREQALEDLGRRYDVPVAAVDVVPAWLRANDMPQGKPPTGRTVDLDSLLLRLVRSVDGG